VPINLEEIIREKGNIPGNIEKIKIFDTW